MVLLCVCVCLSLCLSVCLFTFSPSSGSNVHFVCLNVGIHSFSMALSQVLTCPKSLVVSPLLSCDLHNGFTLPCFHFNQNVHEFES